MFEPELLKFGHNFVETMIDKLQAGQEVKVVNDQYGAITWTRDLAEVIFACVRRKQCGVLHAANAGNSTWYEVAEAIQTILNTSSRIIPCGSNEYPTKAQRPINSRLDLSSLNILDIRIRHWREALEEYLRTLCNE